MTDNETKDTAAEETAETAQAAEAAENAEAADTANAAPEDEIPEGKLKGADKKRLKKAEAELAEANKRAASLEASLAEEKDRYARMFAEYENFRRRTAKEKEGIWGDAYADAVKSILPVIDNLERAAAAIPAEEAETPMAKGVQLTLKTALDALSKLGVTEVPCETFDPNLHNAVMHVDDESRGEGEIVAVFQKGYMKDDRIIRYAMVQVAN